MYSKSVAFILGLISFVPPFNGLLRFYLKKWGSGGFFTLTAGCCWIGNILDIVQIPRLVNDANRKLKQRELARLQAYEDLVPQKTPDRLEARPSKAKPDVEKLILQSAKKNRGYTTPSEIALESELTIEEARTALDKLVSRGYAAMKVNKSGVIVYHFPDFLENTELDAFEDL